MYYGNNVNIANFYPKNSEKVHIYLQEMMDIAYTELKTPLTRPNFRIVAQGDNSFVISPLANSDTKITVGIAEVMDTKTGGLMNKIGVSSNSEVLAGQDLKTVFGLLSRSVYNDGDSFNLSAMILSDGNVAPQTSTGENFYNISNITNVVACGRGLIDRNNESILQVNAQYSGGVDRMGQSSKWQLEHINNVLSDLKTSSPNKINLLCSELNRQREELYR